MLRKFKMAASSVTGRRQFLNDFWPLHDIYRLAIVMPPPPILDDRTSHFSLFQINTQLWWVFFDGFHKNIISPKFSNFGDIIIVPDCPNSFFKGVNGRLYASTTIIDRFLSNFIWWCRPGKCVYCIVIWIIRQLSC